MLYNETEIDEGLLKIASAAQTPEEWEARMAGAVAGVALFRSLVEGKLERDRAQCQPDTISHWILGGLLSWLEVGDKPPAGETYDATGGA